MTAVKATARPTASPMDTSLLKLHLRRLFSITSIHQAIQLLVVLAFGQLRCADRQLHLAGLVSWLQSGPFLLHLPIRLPADRPCPGLQVLVFAAISGYPCECLLPSPCHARQGSHFVSMRF